MKLILPIPPSVNVLTKNVRGKGRVKTKRYMEWIRAAGWDLQAQGRGRNFNNPVVVSIALSEKSRMDLDNCAKAAIDLLVEHRVIPDDRKAFVRDIRLTWQDEDDKIHVTVEPIAIADSETLDGRAAA